MENFILNTEDKINAKADLIDSLIDINKAIKLQKKNKTNKVQKVEKKNLPPCPMDQNYDNLKTKIESLKEDSKEFKMLETYCLNTC